MTIRKSIRTRLATRTESGFTVSELVVVLALFSVVSIATLNFLDSTSRITARTERHAQAESDSQLALRIVTQNIRGAQPIGGPCTATTDTATPSLPVGYKDCIQFQVSHNATNGTSCARSEFVYAIVGTVGTSRTLVENRRDYTGTTTCTASPLRLRRVLLTNVVNTATQPLFTYYRADGTVIDTAATPSQVPNAESVKVSLRVQHTNGATPLFFSSVAAPRNTR